MARSERERPPHELSPRKLPGALDLGQVPKSSVFEPMAKVTERILVWDKINSKFTATCVEFQNLFCADCSPILPYFAVARIGEGMLGVKLKLIDLKVRQLVSQSEQRLQSRHASARYVQQN